MLKLAASLLLLVPQAQADDCYSRNRVVNFRDLIHNVMVVDENGRKTEQEYAEAKNLPLAGVQNRFAATGKLKCPGDGNELSAQLTGANDVITTAAHGMFSRTNCMKITTIEQCTFTVKVGNQTQTSRVSNLVGSGFDCSVGKPLTQEDWAVLKLDPPIRGVNPYELPGRDVVKDGDNVVSVAAESRDFIKIDPSSGKRYLPKSIEDCQVKLVTGVVAPATFESNCDSGKGASGGSILKRTREGDVMMGITVSNKETEQMVRNAERTGTPNSGPYQRGAWTTFHVPLTGTFLKTVEKATGGRAI